MNNYTSKLNLIATLLIAVLLLGCIKEESTGTDSSTTTTDTTVPTCKIIQKVIYGNDDRTEYYQTNNKNQKLADATVALVSTSMLQQTTTGYNVKYTSYNLQVAQNLCEDENFSEQNVLAFCSGFLIAPNIIVTAGHCISDQTDCSSTKFIFDNTITESNDNKGPSSFTNDKVYSCQSIIHTVAESGGRDFAIIELDRDVENRTPLKIRTSGTIALNDPLTVFGHPSGIPLKIADNAYVRSIESTFFETNLDTFGGNSGSAVINNKTLEVEGILVRGETDYQYDAANSCYRVNNCSDTGCSGEDVTKITEIISYLPSTSWEWPGNLESDNSCPFANDGQCDDGRLGSLYSICQFGTDEIDCADVTGEVIVDNTCS